MTWCRTNRMEKLSTGKVRIISNNVLILLDDLVLSQNDWKIIDCQGHKESNQNKQKISLGHLFTRKTTETSSNQKIYFYQYSKIQYLQLWWLIRLGWLGLSLWSLQVILCIIHSEWLELPLAWTIFHGLKTVRVIEVVMYVINVLRFPTLYA